VPRSRSPKPKAKSGPARTEIHASTAKGKIKRLVGGQGSGLISADRGDVFFHKSDVQGKYWELQVGDPVVFELLDDPISGPRAEKVRPARKPKKPKA
jgi:cold shock CspA family protein